MSGEVKRFFIHRQGSVLLAWRRRFGDTEESHHGKIPRDEFASVLQDLRFEGNLEETLQELDSDGCGYITLERIDEMSDDLWASFTKWCANTFPTAEDMVAKFSAHSFRHRGSCSRGAIVGREPWTEKEESHGCTKRQFVANASRLGWFGAHEAMLFDVLDENDVNRFQASNLSWFDREKRKEARRLAVKRKARRFINGKTGKVQGQQSLEAFIAFLKRQYGCLFRAWRASIDADGDMSVSRSQFVQVCKKLEWTGDVTSLWKTLDADDSGSTSIDELAPSTARQLALFKRWADKQFGSAKDMLHTLDSSDPDRFRPGHWEMEEWVAAMESLSCPCDAEGLFALLDWQRHGEVTKRDVSCLDKWQPPNFLIADANHEAAEEIKQLFHKKFKSSLAAWRIAIDRDGCGRICYTEFQAAAAAVAFCGDVDGAWLALDEDCSGHITLHEFDNELASMLGQFRRWAQREFGSALLCFEELLPRGAEVLNWKQFRKQMQLHEYRGSLEELLHLFKTLDCDGGGSLSHGEVAFLDEWDLADLEDHAGREVERADVKAQMQQDQRNQSIITRKSTLQVESETCRQRKNFHPTTGNRLLQMMGWFGNASSKGPKLSSRSLGGRYAGSQVVPSHVAKAGLEVSAGVPIKVGRWRQQKKTSRLVAYVGGAAYGATPADWRNPSYGLGGGAFSQASGSRPGTSQAYSSRPGTSQAFNSRPCSPEKAFRPLFDVA